MPHPPTPLPRELTLAVTVGGGGGGLVTAHLGSSCRRFVQNPTGGDYGHHMSRAACNIGAVLMSQELKAEGIPVLLLHVRLLIG